MSEPEDVILEGAHAATTFVARLWRRHRPGPPRVELADVRPRLELLVGAIFGGVPAIVPAEPPALPSLAGRIARRIPRHLIDGRAHASTDGARIRLPREIEGGGGQGREAGEGGRGRMGALVMYRLMAVEQAARSARGTPDVLGSGGGRAMPTAVRDLFLLCEAAAVDRWLMAELPGLAGELRAARAAARLERPPLGVCTERELVVESLLRALLEAPPEAPPHEFPVISSSEESLEWARERGAALAGLRGRYRGVPPVALWGRTQPLAPDAPPSRGSGSDAREPELPSERVRTLRRRPRIRPSPDAADHGAM